MSDKITLNDLLILQQAQEGVLPRSENNYLRTIKPAMNPVDSLRYNSLLNRARGQTQDFMNYQVSPELTAADIASFGVNATPFVGDAVAKATVKATVVLHTRGAKVNVVKFKRRKRYMRNLGHKQRTGGGY